MKLALSWEAAPDLPLADLVDACRRRGLAAVELGSSSVLAPPADDLVRLETICREDGTEGVGVAAVFCPVGDDVAVEMVLDACARLGVPSVLPAAGMPEGEIERILARAAAVGGRILLLHGTDPREASRLATLLERSGGGSAALAWQIDPATDDAAGVAEVVGIVAPLLEHVRLRGGGPEAHQQSGLGVGALMGRLTLARYQGHVVLTPSRPEYHRAWSAWLGRGGGWGCGSKHADAPPLLALSNSRSGT